MCKFHILGMCTKGDSCHFAHERQELQNLPDLVRTKLCKTLINTGVCEDATCRYAHNKEELRQVSGFNDKAPKEKAEALAAQNTDAVEPQEAAQFQAQFGSQAALPQSAYFNQMMSYMPGMAGMDMLHYGQQAQLLQMGHSAHMAEAMRFQAMAMCLEAGQLMSQPQSMAPEDAAASQGHGWWGQPLSGAAASHPAVWPPAPVASEGTQAGRGGRRGARKNAPAARAEIATVAVPEPKGTLGKGQSRQQRSFPSSADDSRRMVVKHTFITLQEEKETLRQVRTASDCLAELGGPATPTDATPDSGLGDRPPTPEQSGLGRIPGPGQGSMPKLSRAYHNDPVQIDFGSLRSLSSNSLGPLADSEEESSGRSPLSRRVEVQSMPGLQRKCQSQPRLNALSEDFAVEEQPLGDLRQCESDGEAHETDVYSTRPEKRSQDTPYPAGQSSGCDSSVSASEGKDGQRQSALLGDHPRMTVKNTFLDFGSQETSRPIRAVHTAGGRLDLMGQE
eukprot:CAMPEP_0170609962 /NCGR_PEP_ID=MMETSP0224-20130122/22399_1 /TAXON_ID=285029 /ORGANISM="Togula jolla, Strain CCCM 725" /LENGTH=505 /DNA_ID=CAMNT_0010935293 /DNA_START=182 /DNA_END=1699 /DNA_ORIENTATION=+